MRFIPAKRFFLTVFFPSLAFNCFINAPPLFLEHDAKGKTLYSSAGKVSAQMKWKDGAILPLALLRKKMACFHFFWTHFRLFSHISAKYSTVLVVAQLLFASSLSLKPHSVNFSWQTSSVLFTLCLLNPNCCYVCEFDPYVGWQVAQTTSLQAIIHLSSPRLRLEWCHRSLPEQVLWAQSVIGWVPSLC